MIRAGLVRKLACPVALGAASFLLGSGSVLLGTCGPFTDVTDPVFCPFVLEAFTLGVTTGTTPTTYSPADPVSRLQMATFLSRSVDGVLRRGNPRGAAQKFWMPLDASVLGLTTVAAFPQRPVYDGADVWVPGNAAVSRVRASDGKLLETWTGVATARGSVLAFGRVIITGALLYQIDPAQPAGAVTVVSTALPVSANGIAFDGRRIWTANPGGPSVSIITPGAALPWTVTTVTTGFVSPVGALFDGANVWVTQGGTSFVKLDSSGAILQNVTVGTKPAHPVFDGTNIWVPNNNTDSVSVVRASSGVVLQTLTGNGLSSPFATAFDGERVMVTSADGVVSLWKAADLSPLGFLSTGASTFPEGVCSDGRNFWITFFNAAGKLARF